MNEGMYGKSLALYLQSHLQERGYEAPFICSEDWGWWIELTDAPFTFGACIYSGLSNDGVRDFACTDGAVGRRKWSWKMMRFVETSSWAHRLLGDMIAIFEGDHDVEIVAVSKEFPDLS